MRLGPTALVANANGLGDIVREVNNGQGTRPDEPRSSRVSRRGVIRNAGVGALGLTALAPLLAACTDEASSTGGPSGARIKMLSTSYGNVVPAVTQGYTAQRYWAKQFNVDLTQLDPGADPAKQLDQMENALSRKWDVAIVNSVIQGNLTSVTQRLIDAGTIVIGYLSDVALEEKPLDGLLTTVQTDNYKIGFDMTTALCNALNGEGTIIETQGQAGGANVTQRHKGFEDAMKSFPGIDVLASDYGNFLPDKTQALWESYVTKFPKIDGGFLHNEDMAFGALNALKAAGRAKQTRLAGVDGTVRGCKGVLDGELFSTVRHPLSQVYSWPVVIGAMRKAGMIDADIPEQIVVPSFIVDETNAQSVIFTQAENVELQ
jgi:ribose transport system substrate-binding protein